MAPEAKGDNTAALPPPRAQQGRRLGLAHILDPKNDGKRQPRERRNALPHVWFGLNDCIASQIVSGWREEIIRQS